MVRAAASDVVIDEGVRGFDCVVVVCVEAVEPGRKYGKLVDMAESERTVELHTLHAQRGEIFLCLGLGDGNGRRGNNKHRTDYVNDIAGMHNNLN